MCYTIIVFLSAAFQFGQTLSANQKLTLLRSLAKTAGKLRATLPIPGRRNYFPDQARIRVLCCKYGDNDDRNGGIGSVVFSS